MIERIENERNKLPTLQTLRRGRQLAAQAEMELRAMQEETMLYYES
jgi:hypothetical protein